MLKRLVSQILIVSLLVPHGAFTASAAGPSDTMEQKLFEIDFLYRGMSENIDFLLRNGQSCSEYFTKSACPNAAAAEGVKTPAAIFQAQAKENVELRKRLAALKGAVQTLDSREPTVENKGDINSCKGAYDVVISEYQKRKTAAEQVLGVLSSMKKDLDDNLQQLRQSGPKFHKTVARCAGENWQSAYDTVMKTPPGGIAEFGWCPMCVKKEIPASAHRGMILLFKSETAACSPETEKKFIQLAGHQVDASSTMKTLQSRVTVAQKDLPAQIATFGQKIAENKQLQSRCGSNESITAAKENPAAKDPSKSDVNPQPEGGKTRGLAVGEKADPKAAAAGAEAPEVEAKKGDAKPGEGEIKKNVVKTEPVKGTEADQAAATANAGGDLTKNPSDPKAVPNNTVKGNAAEAAKSVLPTSADGVTDVSMPEDRPYKERDPSKASETISAEVEEGKANFAKEKADAARLNASTAPAQETLIASPEDRGAGERALADPPKAIAAEVKAGQENLPKQQELDKQIRADAGTQRVEEWKAWEQHRSGDDHQLQTSRILPENAGGTATAAAGSFTNQPLAPYQEKPFSGPAPQVDDRTDLSGSGRPGPDRTKRQPAASDDLNDHVPQDWSPDSSGGNDWGVAQPVADKSKDSSFPTGPVMLGVAALAAGGVAAGVLLSRKKKSSSSGIAMPAPAAPTATATATETSTATATSTASSTATASSTSTATATGTGGGGYFPGTNTATATATSSSTATRTRVNTSTQTATATSNSGGALMPGSFYPGTQVMVPVPISKGK